MAKQEELPDDVKGLVGEDGRNKHNVLCSHCESAIVKKGVCTLECVKLFLHSPSVKGKDHSSGEHCHHHWVVPSMMSFENVGFTFAVPKEEGAREFKYLTCADCDRGPIGLVYTDDRNKHFVAISRVKHSEGGGKAIPQLSGAQADSLRALLSAQSGGVGGGAGGAGGGGAAAGGAEDEQDKQGSAQ